MMGAAEANEKSSSETQCLIRTACKAFHHPLVAFRGNRFNILFYDAAGVFFLTIEYLAEHHCNRLNHR